MNACEVNRLNPFALLTRLFYEMLSVGQVLLSIHEVISPVQRLAALNRGIFFRIVFPLLPERISLSNGTRKRGQSLFSLLLEIESQLRKEGRNDQIEQRKRSKEKDRQRSRGNNLSRYCE